MVLLVLFLAIFCVAVVSAQLFTSGCKKTSVAFLLAVLGCLMFVNEAQAITVQVGANNNAIPVSVATKADTVFIAKTDTVTVLKRDTVTVVQTDTVTIVKSDTVYINNSDNETIANNDDVVDCGDFVRGIPIIDEKVNSERWRWSNTDFTILNDTISSWITRSAGSQCVDVKGLYNSYSVDKAIIYDDKIIYIQPQEIVDVSSSMANELYRNCEYITYFMIKNFTTIDYVSKGDMKIKIDNTWYYSFWSTKHSKLIIPECADSILLRHSKGMYLGDYYIATDADTISIDEMYKHLYKGKFVLSKTKYTCTPSYRNQYEQELDECSASNGELQEQVDELQNEIELLKERIEELESVSAETTSINLVKSSASTPRKYIDALGRDIVNDNFKGVKIPVY